MIILFENTDNQRKYPLTNRLHLIHLDHVLAMGIGVTLNRKSHGVCTMLETAVLVLIMALW